MTAEDTVIEHDQAQGFSVDAEEVARFSALAAKWWDPKGEFAPLHKFNPVRLERSEEHTSELQSH